MLTFADENVGVADLWHYTTVVYPPLSVTDRGVFCCYQVASGKTLTGCAWSFNLGVSGRTESFNLGVCACYYLILYIYTLR